MLVKLGEALKLTARKDLIDSENRPRKAGEQWLYTKEGSTLHIYLPEQHLIMKASTFQRLTRSLFKLLFLASSLPKAPFTCKPSTTLLMTLASKDHLVTNGSLRMTWYAFSDLTVVWVAHYSLPRRRNTFPTYTRF